MIIDVPCRLNDRFYALLHAPFTESGTRSVFHVRVDGIFISHEYDIGISENVCVVSTEYNDMQWKLGFDEIREFCFLTREEAENKLKELIF